MSGPAAPASTQPFAESTPLGLLGLAIGCAALLPVALGITMTPAALRTAAWFCLLFGGGCQMIAGLMALANKNMLGGTMFTTFAFNWIMNWWALSGLSEGKLPDGHVVLSVDICFLLIFVVLTYAFGFFSKLLVAFLVDIDLLYLFRILREALHVAAPFSMLIAVCTVVLAGIALWLAFAVLVNTSAGRPVFPMPGPLFTPPPPAPPAGLFAFRRFGSPVGRWFAFRPLVRLSAVGSPFGGLGRLFVGIFTSEGRREPLARKNTAERRTKLTAGRCILTAGQTARRRPRPAPGCLRARTARGGRLAAARTGPGCQPC